MKTHIIIETTQEKKKEFKKKIKEQELTVSGAMRLAIKKMFKVNI
jgi:hypothetical protein